MKKLNTHMAYIQDILDAKAAQLGDSTDLPRVNPSFIVNFPGDSWKPLILSFTNSEEVSDMEVIITNMAFALGIGHSNANVPMPDLVTIISPTELYGGMNDNEGNPIQESREHQGHALTALSMKPDRTMVFNARNIMYTLSDDGVKNTIEVINDRTVGASETEHEMAAPAEKEGEPDYFVSDVQGLPLTTFWRIFESTVETYEAASPSIQESMDSTAKEILSTTLPWLMADGTLNHINRIGHEL